MADEEQKIDETRLDQFQIEIQKVTNFVNDEKQPANDVPNSTTVTPSMTSDLSVSYSNISDNTPYIHGAPLSSPKAEFHRSSNVILDDVVEIHDLLTQRDHTLFFIADSDDDDDNINQNNSEANDSLLNTLNEEELSEQRLQKQSTPKSKSNSSMSKIKKSKSQRKSKLQQSLSERGLTFAISEGHVYFNWTAFVREFLYNFFNIVALPYILWVENKSGAESRAYWPCSFGLFGLLNLFQMIGFFYINISYFGYYIYKPDAIEYSLTILVYNVLYISRISVIAIKWAYLPPQIFVMMRKKRLTLQQLQMIHLLTGWVGENNIHGLAREIGQCCARLELDINKLKFAFRDERKQMLKSNNLCLRRRCSTYVTYGNLLIPYVVFVSSKYVSKWATVWRRTAQLISPIICSLPLIAKVLQFNSFREFFKMADIWGIIWYIFYFFSTMINLVTLMLFCSVIALDFKRRYQFVRFSTRLIELKKDAFEGFVNFTNYKEHLFPEYITTDEYKRELNRSVIQTLDLSDAETMYNWSLLRAFFLDFGLRFLRREEAILGYFTLSILIIIAFYLTMLYVEIFTPNYWETSFIVLSSIAVLTPAFGALRYATRINQKVAEQRSILADKRLRLENERSSIDHAQIMNNMSDDENDMDINEHIESTSISLSRAILMLEKIMKMLQVDRFRIRLLGYPIDTTVTGIIAAVVGTVGFLVARLLLGNRVQGLPDT